MAIIGSAAAAVALKVGDHIAQGDKQNSPRSLLYFILLLPWKYREIMEHKLADWDANYASEQELELIRSITK